MDFILIHLMMRRKQSERERERKDEGTYIQQQSIDVLHTLYTHIFALSQCMSLWLVYQHNT